MIYRTLKTEQQELQLNTEDELRWTQVLRKDKQFLNY